MFDDVYFCLDDQQLFPTFRNQVVKSVDLSLLWIWEFNLEENSLFVPYEILYRRLYYEEI